MNAVAPARPGPTDRVVIEVPRWFAALGDRGVQAIILLVGGALGGFVAIGLSWSGLAARLDVALQVPFLVSGAFGGVALAGAALGIAGAQLDRRQNAVDRFYMDDMVRDVAALSELLPAIVAARLSERRSAITAPSPVSEFAPAPVVPATRRVKSSRPSSRRSAPTLVSNGRTVHLAECRMAAGKGLPAFEGRLTGDRKACRICKPPV